MNYLIDEPPLLFSPTLACVIGLNESIVLQQMNYWINHNSRDTSKTKTHFRDGRWWTYNSYEGWRTNFPFFSYSAIRRAISSLEKLGIVVSAEFNRDKRDRTKWYSIDKARLSEVIQEYQAKTAQIEQMDCSDWTDDLYTETSTKTSISTVTHTQVLRDRAKSSESVNEEKNAKPEEVDPGDSLRCQQNKEPVVQNRESIYEIKNSGAARRKVESLRVREEKSVTIRNKVNDQGWLVMDRKSCFKMARAIASRRLILVLGELCGIKYQVGTDGSLVGIMANGNTIHIDEAIGKGKQADLLFLRKWVVSEQRLISQGQYNYLLEKLFESSVEWLLTQPHIDQFDSRFIYERFFKRDLMILSRY